MAEPALSLDHVILGVADLENGAGALANVLGRLPSWRGRHPTYGTANVIFRLDNAYLELLAPDPDAETDTAWTGSLGRFLQDHGAGLFSVALQTPDVGATVAAARARGLKVEDPAEGDGVDLDTNARRRWANARIPPEVTRGTRAFFIEHRSPAEALPPASLAVPADAAVSEVLAVGVESGDVNGARQMWRDVFALPESRDNRPAPAPGHLAWVYGLGNAVLMVSEGVVQGQQPDRWAILLLRVSSLDAVAERLGIDYEEADYEGRPGLLTQVAGAPLFLTEKL